MKGTANITVNGKNVTLRFNLGAFEDFQEYLKGADYAGHWAEALGEMKHLRHFLAFASTEPIDATEFRSMTIDEMNAIAEIVQDSIGSGKGKGKP